MIDTQNNETITQVQTPLPVSEPIAPIIVPPIIPQQPETKNKKKIWIAIGVGILLVIIMIIIILSLFRQKNSASFLNNSLKTESFSESSNEVTPIPFTTPVECNSSLAPSNVRPHVRCYYRQSKINFAEAKDVESRISQTVGTLIVPKDLVFEHEETYRGIPIKWTNGQPISANTLSWLKAGLDILPDYFYIEHPLTAIISATDQELGSQSVIKPGPSTLAYASGLNIFLTETTAKGGSTYYPTDKTSVANVLFHEWVHVVQHYEALEIFTEEYLAKNKIVEAMATGPLEKGFAKEVGWIYNSDEFGDGIIAKLKDDVESQKTTDYGKTSVREDMAESGALFMQCKSNEISEARTLWWENTTGKNRAEFCPSRI